MHDSQVVFYPGADASGDVAANSAAYDAANYVTDNSDSIFGPSTDSGSDPSGSQRSSQPSPTEYLRQRLIEEAAMPTVEEVLERAGGRASGSAPFAEAVATLREDRDRR